MWWTGMTMMILGGDTVRIYVRAVGDSHLA